MAQYKPATTLPNVVTTFDHEEPLHEQQIDGFYVERDHSPWREMKARLQPVALSPAPVRLLLTGNSGSGKSTELNKLLHELDNRYRVMMVRMEQIIPPMVLSAADLVLMTATALMQAAGDDAPRQLLQELNHYLEGGIFDRRVRIVRNADSADTAVMETVEFDAFYQKGLVAPSPLNGGSNKRLSHVMDIINMMVDRLQTTTARPLLIVYDDTDKLAFIDAERTFFDNAAALAGIHASAIYTVPSSLWYSSRLHAANTVFSGTFRLPDIRIYKDNDKPDTAGRVRLDDMIVRRMAPDLMATGVREQIVEDSNGRVRNLIGLVHFAAVNAVGRKATKIEQYDADRAACWLSTV